ncbi:unnamed protein product [Dibothriocephalus latus]|uniref:Uncharacterized protein n=1 Tax=Dibothriocephalus latus TaxID=60516 RepID=A0A3P7L2E4_DIBLA|nr:unnamed protein product [Dibothriocephalus latus]
MVLRWRNLQPSAEAFEEVMNALTAFFDPQLVRTSICEQSSLGLHAEAETSIAKMEDDADSEENAHKKRKKPWSLKMSKVPNTTSLSLQA